LNIDIKYEATEQATEFLSQQIDDLKKEISQKEQELQNYGQEKDIVILSDKETTMLDKLSEVNKALTEAQIDRVRKEAYYNEIKNANPDYIPEAISNPLIQRLREDYLKLSREYAKCRSNFSLIIRKCKGSKLSWKVPGVCSKTKLRGWSKQLILNIKQLAKRKILSRICLSDRKMRLSA